MEGLRFPELLIVLAVFMVLFGGAKLPQVGAGLGKAIRNFKDAMAGKGEDQPGVAEALPAKSSASPAAAPPAQRS
jgi:sec-independent protein translocase protein TatA